MVSTHLRVVSLQIYICGPATERSNVRQTVSSKKNTCQERICRIRLSELWTSLRDKYAGLYGLQLPVTCGGADYCYSNHFVRNRLDRILDILHLHSL